MKVLVVGAGYVGLVQAACLSSLGHEVICMDIQEEKIKNLNAGKMPFYEKGLDELVISGLATQNLVFTSDINQALDQNPDLVFLALPTSKRKDGSANLDAIEAVVKQIRDYKIEHTVIVIKSTAPPTTANKMRTWLNGRHEIASNPEFLREGKAVNDFFHPDRIVIGCESARAASLLSDLYRRIETQFFLVSVETAMLSKYAANTFLAARLSLINEVANIADCVGANIKDVSTIIGSDKRIGPYFLRSGCGFGGSCFPKDVLALQYMAKEECGYEPKMIEPIIEINKKQPIHFIESMRSALGDLKGKKILVWGLTFNANTDDIRESPAMIIVRELVQLGAEISVYDPQGMMNAKEKLSNMVIYLKDKIEHIDDADAIAVLTEWQEFVEAPWQEIKSRLSRPIIFDGKNILPHERLRSLGFEVHGIGICKGEGLAFPLSAE